METVDAQKTPQSIDPNAKVFAEVRAEATKAAKEYLHGFGIGSLGGFAYHMLGKSESLSVARLGAAIKQAPFTGLRFAGWYCFHGFIKSKLAIYRDKADSFNSFVAGAAVGGLVAGTGGPVVASALLLGSGSALFDSALDRWYYNKERSDEKTDNLPVVDPFPHFELTNQFLM